MWGWLVERMYHVCVSPGCESSVGSLVYPDCRSSAFDPEFNQVTLVLRSEEDFGACVSSRPLMSWAALSLGLSFRSRLLRNGVIIAPSFITFCVTKINAHIEQRTC